MKRRSLRIGITIGLFAPDQTLWANGILQNAIYLAKAFRHSPAGHEVTLLNTTDVEAYTTSSWNLINCPVMHVDQAQGPFDVVIELGGQINDAQTAAFKAGGAKIVSYCCGPEYVLIIEAIIFRRSLKPQVFINQNYDAVWVIPQVAESSKRFFQTFRRVEEKVVPFVWDPIGLETSCSDLPALGAWEPRDRPYRLAAMEPNIDVMKFCLYPIMIAEQAYRRVPDSIERLLVTNSERFVVEENEFVGLMRYLDIVNGGKAIFTGPVQNPRFLHQYVDIVISHQWGLPLNYFYLEACWQGYPFIHNAELIRDLGFYYAGNDVDAAAAILQDLLGRSVDAWQGWREGQQAAISRFLASDPALVSAYDQLLLDLVDGPARR